MNAEQARRICGPELVADLRRRAHEAGPITAEQARILRRLLGDKPRSALAALRKSA